MSHPPQIWLLFCLTGFLFVAVLGCLEIGRRLRQRKPQTVPGLDSSLNAVDGAIFGLMGLLIAFTFTGAAERFETRRRLIVNETNAIGSAWLRVDLLPAAVQAGLRRDFRDYVDARINYYRLLWREPRAAAQALQSGDDLQRKIWKDSIAACQLQSSTAVTTLVITSLNDMIDITTMRSAALMTHPPLAIYLVLTFLVLASSLLAGFSMGQSPDRNWTHMLLYAATLAVAMYVILDLDYPRIGLIRIDGMDQLLLDLRRSMD